MIRYLFRALLGIWLCWIPLMSAYADELETYVQMKCKKGCIDVDILREAAEHSALINNITVVEVIALIAIESGFIVKAKNRGSLGLMQVHIPSHRSKFSVGYYDPFENIGIGGKIYKACLDRRRGQAWTDSCYRRGEGTRGIDRVYHHKLNKARQEIARLI